ncbi:TIGR01777 family oxidoreductase [Pedobacter sp.]|uniref:TIGR01777 family oxidoreductase n=1 Tax=Pedobacter sp. TaxID=1411316 RepID=UPI0031CDAED8
MAKNILIAGATGLIGQELVAQLQAKGHQVSILTRKPTPKAGIKVFLWNVDEQQIDKDALTGVDTVINLAGEGIADQPWNRQRKQQIIDSRVKSTELLFKAIKETNTPIESYISASGVGYYGNRGDEILDEESAAGDDFMAHCCIEWEKAADQGIALGIRVVKLRTGIVLSERGGALPTLEKPIKNFVGAALGTGKQWMPWIHMDDLVNIYINAVEDTLMFDAYNATAPSPVTNATFTKALAKALHRPVWPINVPKFILKLILGEMSILPLISNNTSAQKILNTGFQFRYLTLENALTAIYEQKK